MARITLRQLLDHAAEHSYGVPAFNITNMEQGLAIMQAAQACDAPVILQASRGARSYAGDIMLAKMMEALEAMFPSIPICIHQDHGNNVATCLSAIQNGFTSVMMDGSLEEDAKTPADYAYNAAITAEVARMAHMVGASVEGPRKFLKPSMDAMASICRARFEAFGTAGHAAAIKVVPIADMAKRYASGALDPRTTTLAAA